MASIEEISKLPPASIIRYLNQIPKKQVYPFLKNYQTYPHAFSRIYKNVYVYHTVPQQMADDPELTCFSIEQFIRFISSKLRYYPENALLNETLPQLNEIFTDFPAQMNRFKNIDIVVTTQTANLQENFFYRNGNIRSVTIQPIDKFGELSKIDIFKFPKSMKVLNLNNNQLCSLNNLKKLTNVVELDLSFNKLTDLKNLNNNFPPNLKKLNLSNNSMDTSATNIDLKIPYTLVELILDNNTIQHLNVLNSTLQKLSLVNCAITNLAHIYLPECLTEINLSSNNISTVEYQWPIWLKKLNLSKNSLANINQISFPLGLEILILNHQCENISIDVNFPNDLTYLDLSYNQRSRIAHINRLHSLDTLKLKDCIIPSLANLNLDRLRYLNISNSIIRIPTGFVWPPTLRKLNVSGCLFKNQDLDLTFTGIESLNISNTTMAENVQIPPHLKNLDMSNCELKKLGFLQLPHTVEYINLASNKLTGIDDFNIPKQVKKLDFSGNKIAKVDNHRLFENCMGLRFISFRFCGFSGLDELKLPPSIEYVWV